MKMSGFCAKENEKDVYYGSYKVVTEKVSLAPEALVAPVIDPSWIHRKKKRAWYDRRKQGRLAMNQERAIERFGASMKAASEISVNGKD